MDNNRELVVQIQRFTASTVSMLDLLKTACSKQDKTELTDRDIRSIDRFLTSSQAFIDQMRDTDNEFDFTRFIRKAFTTLKIKEHCEYLVNKDKRLFEVRDNDNKIQTILAGIDLKIGYNALTEPDTVSFWQYMYLFTSSVFHLIKTSNETAFEKKYQYVTETLEILEADIAKTGVMFNNQIFNPFLGVGNNRTGSGYSVEEMFTGGELPKQQSVSIESVLSMLGVDKMFDEKKLQEELKGFTDEHASQATDKIVGLLGASDKPEVREVCNTLIKDIVADFKINGMSNVGETLKKVAENAKMTIDPNKMKQTAHSMKGFMANGQEAMKDMKDANGNPIGQQLMNSMNIPLSMMNMMNK